MAIASAAMKMKHENDPKKDVFDRVGDLGKFEVFHNNILIGTYVPPKVTAGGVHLPDKTRHENLYQGKVGLVLKKGPIAFVDDPTNKFHGQDVKVGDWVVYRASDGWELIVNNQHCRMLEEAHIRARVESPDVVF